MQDSLLDQQYQQEQQQTQQSKNYQSRKAARKAYIGGNFKNQQQQNNNINNQNKKISRNWGCLIVAVVGVLIVVGIIVGVVVGIVVSKHGGGSSSRPSINGKCQKGYVVVPKSDPIQCETKRCAEERQQCNNKCAGDGDFVCKTGGQCICAL